MDPELKRLLEESLAVSKSNNDLLRSIRRHQWVSVFTSTLFWILMAIIPFFFYQHYLEPIVDRLRGTSTSTPGFYIPSSADFQKLINSLKAGAH